MACVSMLIARQAISLQSNAVASRLQIFFVLDLKTGGDLEHYLLHMDRCFTEEEVCFFAAEILLGIKVRTCTGDVPRGHTAQPS